MAATSANELKKQWRELFHKVPPSHASQDFMRGHIMWLRQAAEQGGLKRATKNQMKHLTEKLRNGMYLTSEHAFSIKSGTKLLREYQGEKHEVIATEEGFRYRGKTYSSLSMIARKITGTRWNGKLFFGVKK